MAIDSKIQWTDHTLNFWTGCEVVSEACKYCYMFRDQLRYGRNPEQVVKVASQTIKKVLREAKPGDKVFVCSWSDFFIEDADPWRNEAWEIIKSRPDLIFQILTKRPERIKECLPTDWSEGYDNVWLGITAENQKRLEERAIFIFEVPAKTKFISAEPLLGPLDLGIAFWDPTDGSHHDDAPRLLDFIDWVIIGGESGNETGKWRYRPSESWWFENVASQCRLNDVSVFMKQLGTHLATLLKTSDRNGVILEEFPCGLQIRQFPLKKK